MKWLAVILCLLSVSILKSQEPPFIKPTTQDSLLCAYKIDSLVVYRLLNDDTIVSTKYLLDDNKIKKIESFQGKGMLYKSEEFIYNKFNELISSVVYENNKVVSKKSFLYTENKTKVEFYKGESLSSYIVYAFNMDKKLINYTNYSSDDSTLETAVYFYYPQKTIKKIINKLKTSEREIIYHYDSLGALTEEIMIGSDGKVGVRLSYFYNQDISCILKVTSSVGLNTSHFELINKRDDGLIKSILYKDMSEKKGTEYIYKYWKNGELI